MHKIVAKALLLDVLARGIVHFEAPDDLRLAHGCLGACNGEIASGFYNVEYILDLGGDVRSRVAIPCDVIENRAGLIEFGPHINKHSIDYAYLAGTVL